MARLSVHLARPRIPTILIIPLRLPSRIQSRNITIAAAEKSEVLSEPAASDFNPPAFDYSLKAAVILSRPPLVTRDLTSFEKSFFFYQRRLNERLALPFTRYFYFPRGTPGDLEWKRKVRQRSTPARDIGKFTGYGSDTWNDEILVGDSLSEPHNQIDTLIRDAQDKERVTDSETGTKKEDSIERPLPRLTDADRKNDLQSLNRALSETLYLVVKGPDTGHGRERWILPQSELTANEDLRTAAERIILQTGGTNMNTWVVGNMPAAHQVFKVAKSAPRSAASGEKTFYMKARMLAGQANLDGNSFRLNDFKWLTQGEMQKALRPRDFAAVKDILADR